LNLIIGLRYDYDNLSKEKRQRRLQLWRLDLIFYKLDNSSSLRGGYGISYDKVNYAVYSDALQNTTSKSYKLELQE
jgi:hypothetical protein